MKDARRRRMGPNFGWMVSVGRISMISLMQHNKLLAKTMKVKTSITKMLPATNLQVLIKQMVKALISSNSTRTLNTGKNTRKIGLITTNPSWTKSTQIGLKATSSTTSRIIFRMVSLMNKPSCKLLGVKVSMRPSTITSFSHSTPILMLKSKLNNLLKHKSRPILRYRRTQFLTTKSFMNRLIKFRNKYKKLSLIRFNRNRWLNRKFKMLHLQLRKKLSSLLATASPQALRRKQRRQLRRTTSTLMKWKNEPMI